MTHLIDWLGIGPGQRSCCFIVGAGGKTTTTFQLARQLASRGETTLVTTTTRMGRDQTDGLIVVSKHDPSLQHLAGQHGLVMVVDGATTDDRKIGGLTTSESNHLFQQQWLDHFVAEADGARSKVVKAPASYEPVIASSATHVIAVIGASALNAVIAEYAHRPELVAAATGLLPTDRLTVAGAARLLADEDLGSRKSVPGGAWFGVLINRVTSRTRSDALALSRALHQSSIPTLLVDEWQS